VATVQNIFMYVPLLVFVLVDTLVQHLDSWHSARAANIHSFGHPLQCSLLYQRSAFTITIRLGRIQWISYSISMFIRR